MPIISIPTLPTYSEVRIAVINNSGVLTDIKNIAQDKKNMVEDMNTAMKKTIKAK